MNENSLKQILVTNINLYLYNLNHCNYLHSTIKASIFARIDNY
ncbi:hypothetical protein MARI151_60460 [Maribacter litoralis]|uniref:Uncharacterized protein n=1 Tax=Maribacter litoralis TaxID=2059726 RepID=A0A653XC25_9FLAO|nr:hypothetical protein MARI151_60460 [Maribacter litoralis]